MTSRSHPRRDFLKDVVRSATVGALVPSGLFRFFAEPRTSAPEIPAGKKTLVLLYLRGGNDALNTIVPWTNKTYYDVRPLISIPAESTKDEPGVIKLDAKHGLHPALEALKPFWDSGKLAGILNVGSPNPTRSHFDAQDFMDYASPGDRTVHQGWLNRYLQVTHREKQSPLRALAMQGLLPRSLRGKEPVLAVPNLERQDSEGLLDLFDDVYKTGAPAEDTMMGGERRENPHDEAMSVGRETIETLRKFWDILEKEPAGGRRVSFPKTPLGQRLATVSRVIRNEPEVEVVALDASGWDHHQGEGSTDGAIQRDLKVLGDALGAFADDLGPTLDRVMVLVCTEFGRTVAENGNRGTDHGRGGLMLALGGPVLGGKIYGDYGALDPKTLADGRDLPVTIDFRSVFSETLAALFDFKAPKNFFPLYAPRGNVGFLRKA